MEKVAISVSEAAAALGVSAPTLFRMIRAGKFPAVKIGTRRWVVPLRALDEWLEGRVNENQKNSLNSGGCATTSGISDMPYETRKSRKNE